MLLLTLLWSMPRIMPRQATGEAFAHIGSTGMMVASGRVQSISLAVVTGGWSHNGHAANQIVGPSHGLQVVPVT